MRTTRTANVTRTADLNADVGEEAGHDDELLRHVTSANVACGAHAGSEAEMRRTVQRCLAHGVAIGAHPGFEDREHFGRRELAHTPVEITKLVRRQLERLATIAEREGARVTHVKAHGALYNMAARDDRIADAVASAVHAHDRSLVVFGLAGSAMLEAARRCALQVAPEAFLDRGYMPDGSLVPRGHPGALIHDVGEAARRAVRMVAERTVVAIDGTVLTIDADTYCVHGDGANVVELVVGVRRALEEAGIAIVRTAGRPAVAP